MSGIGHNRGPSMERGAGFRRTAWAKARRALLTHDVPLEILRRRVARAEALGLPYRTYASIRAATGEDIEAMLFTSNALGLLKPSDAIAPRDEKKIQAAAATLHGLLAKSISLRQVTRLAFQTTRPAPPFTANWSDLRSEMQTWIKAQRLSADRVLMIGDTAFEREHGTAGRLAAFLTAAQYFPGQRP